MIIHFWHTPPLCIGRRRRGTAAKRFARNPGFPYSLPCRSTRPRLPRNDPEKCSEPWRSRELGVAFGVSGVHRVFRLPHSRDHFSGSLWCLRHGSEPSASRGKGLRSTPSSCFLLNMHNACNLRTLSTACLSVVPQHVPCLFPLLAEGSEPCRRHHNDPEKCCREIISRNDPEKEFREMIPRNDPEKYYDE